MFFVKFPISFIYYILDAIHRQFIYEREEFIMKFSKNKFLKKIVLAIGAFFKYLITGIADSISFA